MKSLLSSVCLTACLVAFGLVAAPVVAQSGSTGGFPAPSFNSGPISGGFQGSGSAAPLPSFNSAPVQAGSGTVQPLPSINSGLSQGSGTVQPMPAFDSGIVQGSGTSAPVQSFGAPAFSQPISTGFSPQPCCGGGVISQPAPVFSQPAPVFSQPAPVFSQPVYSAPVYSQPSYTPFRGGFRSGGGCGCGG